MLPDRGDLVRRCWQACCSSLAGLSWPASSCAGQGPALRPCTPCKLPSPSASQVSKQLSMTPAQTSQCTATVTPPQSCAPWCSSAVALCICTLTASKTSAQVVGLMRSFVRQYGQHGTHGPERQPPQSAERPRVPHPSRGQPTVWPAIVTAPSASAAAGEATVWRSSVMSRS